MTTPGCGCRPSAPSTGGPDRGAQRGARRRGRRREDPGERARPGRAGLPAGPPPGRASTGCTVRAGTPAARPGMAELLAAAAQAVPARSGWHPGRPG
ncbi:hypothetical protein HBB16_18620 [Pseudonocardia sp. MCCB 268]|nr:hypothetical protein [Pseudonocardia cytotoxica]